MLGLSYALFSCRWDGFDFVVVGLVSGKRQRPVLSLRVPSMSVLLFLVMMTL